MTKVCMHPLAEGIDYSKTGKESIWGGNVPEVEEHIKKFSGGSWLNIGAGDGRYSDLIWQQAFEYTIMDIDRSALEKVQRVVSKGIDIWCADFMNMDDGDECFDVVFSSGFVYMFDDVREVLRKCMTHVAPGGVLIFDFTVNAKRSDIVTGAPVNFEGEKMYGTSELAQILMDCFDSEPLSSTVTEFEKDFNRANPPFKLECDLCAFTIRKDEVHV
jgi:SAM-dependent methyltransferase